jgi:hypothetical protein
MPPDSMKFLIDHAAKTIKRLDKENEKNPAYPKCTKFCNKTFINKKKLNLYLKKIENS